MTPNTNAPAAKVLYVEDHPVNVLLMKAIFEHVPGSELVIATNGRQALALAQDLFPSLLLLDLRLPDQHGAELLRRLRRVPGCEKVCAIAVTAEHDHDIAGSGFDELWRKPFDVHHTLERIQKLLPPAGLEFPPLTAPALAACIAAWF